MLNLLRIPTHRAPGEAEAECARLQQEGIVDAILSEDGDSLMFGTSLLFKTYYEKKNGKKTKSTTHVRVYNASEIMAKHGLDKEGMICFAMLAGGDYSKGLHGCGPGNALRAAQHGLGRSLCRYADAELRTMWRLELIDFLKGSVSVPSDFPDPKILKKYKEPRVCTPDELHGLSVLRHGWGSRPIDEKKLRSFLRFYFNIWTKGYIKHVLPLLLIKTLTQTQPGQEASNKIYDIKVVNPRKRKLDEGEVEKSIERKITFDPRHVSSLDLTIQPDSEEGEDWSQLETKTDGPFDPTARVDCEVLECVLRRSAPHVLTAVAEEIALREGKRSKNKLNKTAEIEGEAGEQSGNKSKREEGIASITPPTSHKHPRGRPQKLAESTNRDTAKLQPMTLAADNSGSSTNTPAARMTVIDLTLDSDADDENPKKPRTMTPNSSRPTFSGNTLPVSALPDSLVSASVDTMYADIEAAQVAEAIRASQIECETISLLDC